MSTFLQSALASSILCSSASLCALEVREKISVVLSVLNPTVGNPDLLKKIILTYQILSCLR